MSPDPLPALLDAALARLTAEVTPSAPALAGRLEAWMRALALGADPAAYYLNPISFPLLRLPLWLEASLDVRPDPDLQADLVFSSVNGYYFIRLLDNVMDGHAAAGELALLPAAAVFHAHFQLPYQRRFPAGQPFWADFQRLWFGAAEAAVTDASLEVVDIAAFRRWSARKVSAALIPLAAVGHWHGRPERLAAWAAFVDRFGAWHQLFNDVFDWSKDLRLGTRTYFLGVAAQRKRPEETPAAWVVREGFTWGMAQLRAELAAARALAEPLASPAVLAYLDERAGLLARQQAEVQPGLVQLARLAAVMEPAA